MKSKTGLSAGNKKSLAAIKDSTKKIKSGQFPIVGIGASAGGLEALEQFLTNVPANSGMAFVVIQHLDPSSKGMLPEFLQRITEMQVFQVTDRLTIKPDCVYVIPANKNMSILNGALHLFAPLESRGLRLPIDFFFLSLADDRKDNSIGIILSGMGSDGTIGLKAIKEKAGIVMVQDPASAKFDSMPMSAIDSVMVDVVATASELPSKLLAIAKLNGHSSSKKEIEKDVSSLEKIIILLRSYTGNDFSEYKRTTLYRRIERRISIHLIDNIASYVRYLQENPTEIEILFKELLIGVTSFFRDPLVWEHLKKNVLPSLFNKLPNGYIVRAWIPACSTGEEAYTMAIVFKEVMANLVAEKHLSLQVFATDLDKIAVEKARKGIYPASIVSDLSPERLNRFFIQTDGQYRVSADIREMVIFAPQNVIKDPSFTKLEIISCRNLMIYLDANLQKKLLTLFHYSLNQNGLLLLGSAETTGEMSEWFSTVDSKLRIYQRSASSKTEELYDFPSSFSPAKKNLTINQIPVKVADNLQNLTDQLLLQQFTPSSVLVTDLGDILYITGSTGKYLEPAAGKANLNIFAMAREGLSEELPSIFREAMKSFEKKIIHNIKIKNNGKIQLTDITVQQLEKPVSLRGKILVVFGKLHDVELKPSKSSRGKSARATPNADLELELQRVKDELQSTSEEMQTSQEELKSTNEELQSTNEEMQSTNEELSTSKEEMQSLNEELHTVNIELQSKIDDSARVNSDMNNLLRSIDIATLFLDKDLKIRQFTAPSTKIFKFIPGDVGRVFTDQVTDLDYPELYDDAKEVLKTLIYIEKTIPTRDGRWFNVRIMPYRTFEDKIDGLVITFIDNSKSKKLEIGLQETQSMLRSFISAVPGVIIGLSSEGVIIEFNPESEKLFGRKYHEVIGKNYVDLFIPKTARKKVLADLKKLITGSLPNRYKSNVSVANGDKLIIEWASHKMVDENGTNIGIINIGINITKS